MGGCDSGCNNCVPQVGCCPQAPTVVQPQPQPIQITICPATGAPAGGQCGVGGACPPGNACQSGGCCPQPSCSTGQLAISICISSTQCPSGTSCQSGGCCPQPLPTCPNGLPCLQSCSGGTACPSGYGCTSDGGCCQLATAPTCPVAQQSICQCALNSVCPSGSSCNANTNTCCAPAQTPLYGGQVPGMPCTQSSQCNGFSSGCATCTQNACACTSSSYSTGASCQTGTPAVQAQLSNCCSQFGGCTLKFSKAKRRPVLDGDYTNSTEPLFYRPPEDVVRRCPMNVTGLNPDSTCTPEEFCHEGVCTAKLWPGDYGCQRDEQCRRRCASAVCREVFLYSALTCFAKSLNLRCER